MLASLANYSNNLGIAKANMQGEGDQQQQDNQGQNVTKQQGQQNEPQQCPRCDSFNTKFCYYNNYSLSQPRYFCKACKRCWTKGGTFRNVPVGGGSRKGKRAKTGTSSSSPQPPQDQHEREPLMMMSSGPLGYSGGGGYMTSSLPYTQTLGYLGGSSQMGSSDNASNMGMLHGFNNIGMSSYGQQSQMSQIMPSQLYPSHHDQRGLMLQPYTPIGYMSNFPRGFMNTTSHAYGLAALTGQSSMWSNNNSASGGGSSLNNSSSQMPDDHVGPQ